MLEALGVDTTPEEVRQYTRQEERLIAGFEDIQRFVDEHGHVPQHGEDLDIFERLYAVRLDRLRQLPEARKLLEPMDRQGLLAEDGQAQRPSPGQLDEDALLAELGVGGDEDITTLRHVKSHARRQAAEAVADRVACKDFDRFRPLFEQAGRELEHGQRITIRFGRDASIEEGNFFVLGGQMAYVAEAGKDFHSPQGKKDARLRVIFSNGTESNLLRLSLARALYKDDTGRRISSTDTDAGPLFGDRMDEDDVESGTIYVLRSRSEEPFVAEHRELIHKIGVTGGKVETRIASAKHDPTYLMADVDIVATYKLSNINRVKLENLLHRIFAPARMDLSINIRIDRPVQPREWFLVPLPAIDEAVQRIRDGSIADFVYDPETARLIRRRD
ncbi:MAG TPA: GIY-YIG nuclease family protein [Rhodanobacteraceae bacterium]|nr:GIY-YIG nuclease family protein [Rhodanobacteraceae bacterium]